MADNHSKEARSFNMSQIRSSDTNPEILVRKYLFSRGLRFRKNDKRYPGHPDIVLPKYKTIIFVHGCFWHQHNNCHYAKMPASNVDYWKEKLAKNINRDYKVQNELIKQGWRVIVVWECQLKNSLKNATLERLYNQIINVSKY